MNNESRENLAYILLILIILIMAIGYFIVPERLLFLQNQIKWWKGFLGK